MAVMVAREIPHKANPIIAETAFRTWFFIMSSSAINNGWAIRPTRRSVAARLPSMIIDGERIDGFLIMAARTNALPRIDTSINGAFKAQFTTTKTFMWEFWLSDPWFEKLVLFSILKSSVFAQMLLQNWHSKPAKLEAFACIHNEDVHGYIKTCSVNEIDYVLISLGQLIYGWQLVNFEVNRCPL